MCFFCKPRLGTLRTHAQFRYAVKMMDITGVHQKDVDALFHSWDGDASGEIDFTELCEGMRVAIEAEDEAHREATASPEPRDASSFRGASFRVRLARRASKAFMLAQPPLAQPTEGAPPGDAEAAQAGVLAAAASGAGDASKGDASAATAEAPTPEGPEEPTAVHQLCLSEHVWAGVAARTDELYEVVESLEPTYRSALASLLVEECPPAAEAAGQAQQQKPPKVEICNPVAVHMRALDGQAGGAGHLPPLRGGVLPEASVRDVLSAEIVCRDGDAMVRIAERLLKGFTPRAGGDKREDRRSKEGDKKESSGGGTSTLEVVDLKNEFTLLAPTHFRRLVFTLRVVGKGGVAGFAKLELHHERLRAYDEEQHSAAHYAFFRARVSQTGQTGQLVGAQQPTAATAAAALTATPRTAVALAAPTASASEASASVASPIDQMLERVLAFLIEAAAVPVLLSLLVLVFTTTTADGSEDLSMLPQSSYELYAMATQSAVTHRLIAMKRVGGDSGSGEGGGSKGEGGGSKGEGATAAAAGAAKGAAAAGGGGEGRTRLKRKDDTKGWRTGAATSKGESSNSLGLEEHEVDRVYGCVAKILTLLAQGRQGLSELKEAYLPKDKRLRPLISKMLDNVTKDGVGGGGARAGGAGGAHGKQQPSKLETAGLNMLRLVAVDNQKQRPARVHSTHVANALVTGGRRCGATAVAAARLRGGWRDARSRRSSRSPTRRPPCTSSSTSPSRRGFSLATCSVRSTRSSGRGGKTDATAAEFLNNAYMNNVCRIAAGELGKRLAKLRPVWSFTGSARLGWVGKAALWSIVMGNELIESLDVSGSEVGPGQGGAEADVDSNGLSVLFASCTNLHTVKLAFNNLGAFSSKQLSKWCKGLKNNRSLTSLDLQSNKLGADGVKTVVNALRHCVCLKALNLSRNQPGGRPEALVQLVQEHPQLENLSVVEEEDKHLTSARPRRSCATAQCVAQLPRAQLAYLCVRRLRRSSRRDQDAHAGPPRLPADVTLLAGAATARTPRSPRIAASRGAVHRRGRSARMLGKALLENESGRRSATATTSSSRRAPPELRWDLKDGTEGARRARRYSWGFAARQPHASPRSRCVGLTSGGRCRCSREAVHTNTTLQTSCTLEQSGPRASSAASGTNVAVGAARARARTGCVGRSPRSTSPRAGELTKTSCLRHAGRPRTAQQRLGHLAEAQRHQARRRGRHAADRARRAV